MFTSAAEKLHLNKTQVKSVCEVHEECFFYLIWILAQSGC